MISAIRASGARILDNAMLYKDMTQWLRNKTFLVLFFGLLAAAEGISIFIMALGEEVERPGVAVFGILYFILLLYGFIIAFMGHNLTSREFQNKTFELYELSGMSLERMIGGKFLSMVYQFFFGFCCIVPFLFFAYFLGGLDFLDIVTGAIFVALVVPPAYLLALLTALTSKLKQISTLGKIGAVGLVIALVFVGIMSLFSRHFFGTAFFNSMTALLKMILSGDTDAMFGVGVFLVFYAQLCLLLFYLCCHMVSRETDSREVAIKALCLTLALSWMALIATLTFINTFDREVPHLTFVPVYALFALAGLLMFFSPMRIPVIVRNRYRGAGRIRKGLYWFFQPGPNGFFRYLLLVIAICIVFSLGMYMAIAKGYVALSAGLIPAAPTYVAPLPGTPGGAGVSFTSAPPTRYDSWNDWARVVSFMVQLPFFIAFPIGFFTAFFPKVRENVVLQRTLVACWWGLVGAVIAFYAVWVRMYKRDYSEVLDFLSMILSPVSAIIVTSDVQSPMYDFGVYVRVGVGLLGIYLMHGILRRRALQEELLVPVAVDTVTPLAAAATDDDAEVPA